jgi:decaprenyl-phosphate phosphoribosyltransferase
LKKIDNVIQILRFPYQVKNIFVIFGVLIAYFQDFRLHGGGGSYTNIDTFFKISIGLLVIVLSSSANYVLNEWLDRESDSYHPTKKFRPCVTGEIGRLDVIVIYFSLVTSSILLSVFILNLLNLVLIVIFLTSGLVYNVSPIRAKDKFIFDSVVEAANNPVRFLFGVYLIGSSENFFLISLYSYFFGLIIMGLKRYSEVNTLRNVKNIENYRRSLRPDLQNKLKIALFIYYLLFLSIVVILSTDSIFIHPIYFIGANLVFTIGQFYNAQKLNSPLERPEIMFKDPMTIALTVIFLSLVYVSL